MPEDELGQEEEVTVEPFMVEEETEEKVCLNCSKLKVGTKVCGLLKPFREYMRSNGVDDIETTHTCGEYEAV